MDDFDKLTASWGEKNEREEFQIDITKTEKLVLVYYTIEKIAETHHIELMIQISSLAQLNSLIFFFLILA